MTLRFSRECQQGIENGPPFWRFSQLASPVSINLQAILSYLKNPNALAHVRPSQQRAELCALAGPEGTGCSLRPVGCVALVCEYACMSTCKCQSSLDRKSTRLNSSHANISYAVFC